MIVKKAKLRNIETYAFENRELFLEFIKDKKKILVAVNAEKILNEDKELHRIANNNIAYPDGVGAVMALRKKGLNAVKIPGAEFWLDIINRFYKEKSFYLIGGTQYVIENTIEKLQYEYLDINIVGFRNGFLKPKDKEKLIIDLVEKKPDIVFVAQGSPRQELLMDQLMSFQPALYMGLGGSFDVYCGLKKRAPKLFLQFNLEWLYRLFLEPTRIKRQVLLLRFYLMYHLNKI